MTPSRRGGKSLTDTWRQYWPVDHLQEILEQEKRLRELIDPPSLRLLRQIDEKQRILNQSHLDQLGLRMLDPINASLLHMAEAQFARAEVRSQIEALEDQVLESAATRARIENSLVSEFASRFQAATLAEISIAAQTALAEVPWNLIGEAVGVSAFMRVSLQDHFARFTESYARLYQGILEPSATITPLPSVVWDAPPGELFRGVELLRAVTLPPARRKTPPAAIEGIAKQLAHGEDPLLEALLLDLDPDLLIPLAGARGALRSTNPDRARHFSSSLRELFTQVLHRLAPDKAVQGWTSNPEHYDKGRPTRRARLLYICSTINYGDFSDVVEADVSATLKYLGLFQGGTHKVRSDFSEDQLHALFVRMAGLLQFLLKIIRSAP